MAKVPTGIEGFDKATLGGLPRSRTTLLLGGPGTGKTVLALQTLVNGARKFGEPGLFVAFEENTEHILANAASFDWNLSELAREKIFFVDARLSPDIVVAGTFNLSGMLAGIKAEADARGAKRIVFDSIDVLLALLDDPVSARREVYRLHEWLAESGLSGIITAKGNGSDPRAVEDFGFMHFMADCVVALKRCAVDQIVLRYLQIVKYRGSSHAENETPFAIGVSGVEVAVLGETPMPEASRERVSSGVGQLDTMLGGGYFRRSSVLITGTPGTGKSILSGAFAEAACRRRERALICTFDQTAAELVRDLSSVKICLAPHLKSGLLNIHAGHTETCGAEVHLLEIRRAIREHQPGCMVIDPLSAMTKASGAITAGRFAERLLHIAKAEGITLVSTSLLPSAQAEAEETPLQISTIADTWIHLTNVSQAGERNRALTIVKSRGTRHSNQGRELILSDEGVSLTDVYASGGQVLMGTARWEKEAADKSEQERVLRELEQKRRSVALARADLAIRIDALDLELKQKEADAAQWLDAEAIRRRGVAEHRGEPQPEASPKAAAKKRRSGRKSERGGT